MCECGLEWASLIGVIYREITVDIDSSVDTRDEKFGEKHTAFGVALVHVEQLFNAAGGVGKRDQSSQELAVTQGSLSHIEWSSLVVKDHEWHFFLFCLLAHGSPYDPILDALLTLVEDVVGVAVLVKRSDVVGEVFVGALVVDCHFLEAQILQSV